MNEADSLLKEQMILAEVIVWKNRINIEKIDLYARLMMFTVWVNLFK